MSKGKIGVIQMIEKKRQKDEALYTTNRGFREKGVKTQMMVNIKEMKDFFRR